MAHRTASGEVDLFADMVVGTHDHPVLRTIDGLVDWPALRTLVAPAYDASGIGRPGTDPVWLIKMLLLESLFGLSDVQCAWMTANCIPYRRFVGVPEHDMPPDDTTLVRFRDRLRRHGLHDKVMAAINGMLAAQGLGVRPGSIKMVDATLVRAAVAPPRRDDNKSDEASKEPRADDTKNEVEDSHAKNDVSATDATKPLRRNASVDPDADWTKKNGRAHHGYKLHIAQDATTGFVTAHTVTKASVHDTNVLEQLLDGTEKSVLADKGYIDAKRDARLRKKGTTPHIMARIYKNMSPSMKATTKRINRAISSVRSAIEPTFANLKRWRHCGRAVYIGLVKVTEQMNWGVLAVNLMVAHRWLAKAAAA